MFIKNNSKREWKNYNCGEGTVITIKPESTFEVDDKAGVILLRNLGCDKWLTKVEGETSIPIEEQTKMVKEVAKESIEDMKKFTVEKETFKKKK